MDDYRYLQPNNAARHRAMHTVAIGASPMMGLMMHNNLDPVLTSSGFVITRRRRSGDVAATKAGGEELC